MRIAIVSDIHGNQGALAAVLQDLKLTAPDIVLHGGDLADGGSGPIEVVDCIRSLGWQGVMGNTDQMLATPGRFEEFAARSPRLETLWKTLREVAVATRAVLGEERLAWLRDLPLLHLHEAVALVHASPQSAWTAPSAEAGDDELHSTYGALGRRLVVYGHIHRPFVRKMAASNVEAWAVANAGSVGLPYDGDPRASYLLIDEGQPEIRRVTYDIDKEVRALTASGRPHAGWIARMLRTAAPQMP